MTLFDLTTYLSVLHALIAGFFFRRISLISLRILIIYTCFQTIADLFLIYVFPIEDGHLIRITYSILKPVEYGIYAYLFFSRIRSALTCAFASLSTLIVVAASALQLSFMPNSQTIATNVILMEGVLTICLVLLYFRFLLLSRDIILLSQEPFFWLATGLLFFYAGNIVSTGFYFQLKTYSENLAGSLYLLNYTLGILNFLLSAIAFVIAAKTK